MSDLACIHQVVFIDSRVPDLQDLIDGVKPGELAFVLDSSSDGVQQIADILAANNLIRLSAISIVSHGSAGRIDLGSMALNDSNLSAHSSALAQIGASLAPAGNLQLFGCDVASGARGQQFIADLSRFTGAAVLAATHVIGRTASGENWLLDASTGPSTAPAYVPFTAEAQANFSGQLVLPLTAQLYFRINQGNDVQLGYINSDGTPATPNIIYYGGGFDSTTTPGGTGNETSVAVDTAAGLVFSVGVGNHASFDAFSVHNLYTGALISTTEFGANTGSANTDDIVQALAIDPFTHTLYVGDWGTTLANTGVREFTYNPANGALTPVATNGGFLFTASQIPSYVNANAFYLDTAHHLLYYVNDDSGYNTAPFSAVNGVYVVDINSPTSATQLTTNANTTGGFPVGPPAGIGVHGNLLGLAVDVADGVVFFESTDVQSSANNALWRVSAAGGANQTATKITLPAGVTLNFAGQTNEGGDAAGLTFDAETGNLYLSNAYEDGVQHNLGSIYILHWDNGTKTVSSVGSFDTATLVGASAATVNAFDAPSATTLDDLPVLTTSDTTTHAVEQSPAVTLLTGTPTITDTDGDHLVSATVQITGGTFTVPGNDSSANDDHLTINGTASGTVGGTSITYSYNSATETLTLTGYDTLAHYQTALADVQYNTTGHNPTDYGLNATRTITWQVNDGAIGNPSGPNTTTTTLNIDAVNDAPVANAPASYTAAERVPLNLHNAGLNVSDVDGGITGQNEVATLSVSEGILTVVAGTGASSGVTIGGSGTATVTLTGTIAQINGILNSDNTSTLTFTGNIDANDTPNSTTLSLKINDNGFTGAGAPNPLDSNTATSTITAPDDTVVSISGLTGANAVHGTAVTASITDGGLAVTGATYQWQRDGVNISGATSATYTPTEHDENHTLSVNVGFTDEPGNTETGTGTAGTVQESPPVFTNLGGTPHPHFTEKSSSVVLDNDVTISDAELDASPSHYAGASLTLARHGGANPDDSFAGTGSLDLADSNGSGENVSLDNGTTFIGTFTNPGDGTFSITFNAQAHAAEINSVMHQIVYADTSDNPPASVQIDYTFNDGDGDPGAEGIATGSVTVDITQVDDPPVLINVAPTAAYSPGSPGAVLSPALGVFDPDATPPSPLTGLASATIKIASGFFAGDELFVNLATSGGHFVTPDGEITNISVQSNVLGTLILSGNDTVSRYQSVLDAVSYHSTAADPSNGGADPTRNISWQVNDGALNSQTPNPDPNNLVNETVLHFDVAPTVDLDASGAGTGFTTTFTENGAPIAIVDTDVSIVDPDNANIDSATIVLTNAKATDALSIAGTLPGGIDSSVDTSVPGQITLHLLNSASLADYQTALGQVRFVNSSDAPDTTDRDITVSVANSADSNVAHATVHVIAVNDAPVNTVPNALSVNEDTGLAIGGLAVNDVDAGSGTLTTTLSVAHGTLTVASAGGAGVSGSGTGSVTLTGTLAQVNTTLSAASNILYQPLLNYNGGDTLTFVTNDGGNTGTGGPLSDTDTVAITVNAVNDAPVFAHFGSGHSNVTEQTFGLLNSAATVSDVELDAFNGGAGNYAGASLIIGRTVAANVEDTFGFGSAGASFTVNTVNHTLLAGGQQFATYSIPASGALEGTIAINFNSLNTPATTALVNNVLEHITYKNLSDAPPASVTMHYTFNDGNAGAQGSGGLGTGIANRVVDITAVNDPPVIDLDSDNSSGATGADYSTSYAAGGSAVPIADVDVSLVDPDNTLLASATITLTNVQPGDLLAVNGSLPGGISASNFDSGTGVLTLSGSATLAAYQTALHQIEFSNSGSPDVTARDITVVVNDGSANSNIAHTAITLSSAVFNDFDANGISDVLLRHVAGNLQAWSMNGAHIQKTFDFNGSVGNDWHNAATGDFNGDGHGDLLWRNDNGQVGLWESQLPQSTQPQIASIGFAGNDWKIAGSGDFTGDGKADILWRHDSGQIGIWEMNGPQVISSQSINETVGSDWHVAGINDFTGDGKADILWRNDNGQVGLWEMNGAQHTSHSIDFVTRDWHIEGTGDFNGDGKADILWRNDNGQVGIWEMDGSHVLARQSVGFPGNDWHVADTGDYNGDGKQDILWHNDNGQVGVWLMNGAQIASTATVTGHLDPNWTIIGHHFDLI